MATSLQSLTCSFSHLSFSSGVTLKTQSSFPLQVDHQLNVSTINSTTKSGTCRNEGKVRATLTHDQSATMKKGKDCVVMVPVCVASKRHALYQILTYPLLTNAVKKNIPNNSLLLFIDGKAKDIINAASKSVLSIQAETEATSIRQKIRMMIMAKAFPLTKRDNFSTSCIANADYVKSPMKLISLMSPGVLPWLSSSQAACLASELKVDPVYEVGELFELGIQVSYLLLLLALLGAGTFFVIRQVLLRRELDLSAKELQEQVRSGDANATELFELGAVMLRRKFYPAATKYLLQAIDKWDGDDQDLCQVYNALGVSYVREGKLDKGISQFETAVKIQPGYVTAWNNLGDAYEKKKELKLALKAFEEVLLFDPNNEVARPRVDSLRDRVKMYKGVPIKSKEGVPIKSKER